MGCAWYDSSDPEFITYLESLQSQEPTNLILAHDLGLAYYVQAQIAPAEEAYIHWQGVIANWLPVLESDDYWIAFHAERDPIYNRGREIAYPITGEEVEKTRQQLREKIQNKIQDLSQKSIAEDLHTTYLLERRAIRLIQELDQFTIHGTSRSFGPLWASRIPGVSKDVRRFFKAIALELPRVQESLAFIQQAFKEAKDFDLRQRYAYMCFSTLGRAAILVERREPQQAAAALAQGRCPTCRPPDCYTVPSNITLDLPPLCEPDCPHFHEYNPSYAALENGPDLHFQHAIELSARVQIAFLLEALDQSPVDGEALRLCLARVAVFANILGIRDALMQFLADQLRAWAKSSANEEVGLSDAITVLETAIEVAGIDDWNGELAAYFNLRGVAIANNESDWACAAADLIRSYQLNPNVPTVAENLETALVNWRETAYKFNDYKRANWIDAQLTKLKNGEPPDLPDVPTPPPPPPSSRQVVPPDERDHPILYDQYGDLNSGAFRQSALDALHTAHYIAVALHKRTIQVPPLIMALVQAEHSTLNILLRRQEIDPQAVFEVAESYAAKLGITDKSGSLGDHSVLNQEDFQTEFRYVLRLAWEVASYDMPETIGDYHLLAGLILQPTAVVLLREAEVDTNLMNTHLLGG